MMKRLQLGLILGALSLAPATALGEPTTPGADVPAEDIRDIRGPLPIEAPWWHGLAPWAAGGAGLALAGAAAVLWARRSRPADPRRGALEALDRARAFARQDDPQGFAEAVSLAIRHYIEARFGLQAPRLTTEEFLAELAAAPASPLGGHRAQLAQLLSLCDLVKFGGFSVAAEEMDRMHALAAAFVESSSRDDAQRSEPGDAPATPMTVSSEGAA